MSTPDPISPCYLQWNEEDERMECVNHSPAHEVCGHQRTLQPLLSGQ